MHNQTVWVIIGEVLYIILVLTVCIRVVYDTRSVTKTLAYLLLVILVPVGGMIFYFTFGINYRKRKIYSKKLAIDEQYAKRIRASIAASREHIAHSHNPSVAANQRLVDMLHHERSGSIPLIDKNEVSLLINGEAFFPSLLEALRSAQRHIHIQFYIYENDRIGNEIKDILIAKARAGVCVRFIYDDFGSRNIRHNIARELRAAGVEAYPFYKVNLLLLANRINYRNHRKIVVIDGDISFTGGINVSDRYFNTSRGGLFWRDTNIMIRGRATAALQHVFLSDWNFCSGQNIGFGEAYINLSNAGKSVVQVLASGPDSDQPVILNAIVQAIALAQKEVLITTPYFIPDVMLQQVLCLTALSGVNVSLLVPGISDSRIVDLASKAYFEDLLKAGVRIYQYQKGFIHAKTIVTDRLLASVGTANLDVRSFDLNFETSTLIYDEKVAGELADVFYQDLEDAVEIDPAAWLNRSRTTVVLEKFIRLTSPFI